MLKPKNRGLRSKYVLPLCLLAGSFTSFAQDPFAGMKHLFTTPQNYVVTYTSQAPKIDGKLEDAAWQKAAWTKDFQDIEGDLKPKPTFRTRAKMLWDDNFLYIVAELEEPHVWANLTKRDEVVYYDNDFEVFIDPDNNTHQYFEIEINALNTIFDLFMPKPYRNGSGALISWDTPGMLHAIDVQGTINKASDTDKGWTVEMAIPYSALSLGNNADVPKEGTTWRINFSRVEWETEIKDGGYVKKKNAAGKPLPENNWVWSPQGVINMHVPERWGYLLFTRKQVGESIPAFSLPYAEQQKQYLWLVYYKQKEFMDKNKRYAASLSELKINPTFLLDDVENTLSMEATKQQFKVSVKAKNKRSWSVNDEGLVQ